MARKEWIQLRRDKRSVILAFALPFMLLIFLGYAISFDVDDIEVAVLDEDQSAASRALLDAFETSGYFTITDHLTSSTSIDELLTRGLVRGVLTIPTGFSKALAAPGTTATIQSRSVLIK